MTSLQLRQAITGPAAAVGSSVDAELTEAMLAEVATRPVAGSVGPAAGPGVLPLLSHALDQAWQGHTGPSLTLADYERTGGIRSAVARSAQDAYEGLTPDQRLVARRVFTMLVGASPDGTDAAVPRDAASLVRGAQPASEADLAAVLDAFAARRLLTLTADTVEITHEALLTAWPLLHDHWLAETRADRMIRTGLGSAAAEWVRHDRDPAYLYTGSLLETATATVTRGGDRIPPLTDDEQAFLAASGHARDRRARLRTGLIALLAALSIALAAITGVALDQRNTANSERNQANTELSLAASDA
jgi:Novel STAND NTPase 1